MGKDNINEYLKFLENIVQFQSYVLEHIHDDFSVLFDIISKSLGIDAMLTYTCTQFGMVDSVVYDKDISNPARHSTYLNAGLGRMFNNKHDIYASSDELPDDMKEEIQCIYKKLDGKGIIVCSGEVEKLLYSVVLIQGEHDAEMGIEFADCSDMFLNSVHLMMESRLMTQKVRYDSEHDLLTGLYNRRCYFTKCKEEYNMLASVGIFFMDVNYLKKTNDMYGHDAGDALLKKAAESIKAMVCENIHGFRMGGDEFIMVALNCAEGDVAKIKARWEKELENVNEKYGMNDPCSVAVGTAFAKGSFQIEELCKIADDRMYENKRKMHSCRL
ncbi:GGDEF domain-containing protein [Eubacterium sp. MSJ-13]|uniref:GGDEF domain-containing protein n=1 Tax=Eubacterium sp. MSJ-13 TaxID=2841513 RepID=UPI001C121A50|nr:GGDEF domain-containing protein [Eubacterium sp. MSJ-13]MBU5479512.1 GGDEF domain-containing protein [Eubacterium sp. MSJ-13]